MIENGKRGPGGRQVVRLTNHVWNGGRLYRTFALLEATDLHLLPFYLRTSAGEVFQVYRFDRRRRVRQVRRDIRARLVNRTNEWDTKLWHYLAERQMLGN